MQANSNKKNPRVAGVLALVGGPVGFLYVGWRYALAATVVFLSFMLIFAFLLFAPPWLKYVNLPAFAFMAYRICERLNGLADRGQDRAVLDADTWPVAAFAQLVRHIRRDPAAVADAGAFRAVRGPSILPTPLQTGPALLQPSRSVRLGGFRRRHRHPAAHRR